MFPGEYFGSRKESAGAKAGPLCQAVNMGLFGQVNFSHETYHMPHKHGAFKSYIGSKALLLLMLELYVYFLLSGDIYCY